MKLKCIGNPHCMKTFEYGHALRAHLAACDEAQKILQAQSNVEKLENDIKLNYPGIKGLHRNPHYPIAHHIDETLKFKFADAHKFNYVNDGAVKRMRKANAESHMYDSTQIKRAMTLD